MKALIVIDMQNDFIDGSLGTPEAVAIIPVVKKLIDEGDYHRLIFTRDTHENNYLLTQEGQNLPVKHCIKNTHGWKIHNDLDTSMADAIVDKPSFGWTGWNCLRNKWSDWHPILDGMDEIILVGLCTDICVISNAMLLKAFYPEVPISVDASACAGVTPQSHKNALEAMKMCQIDIVNE